MNPFFVGSFDPPHIGHKKTFELAQQILKIPINIAICQNTLKTKPMFCLSERKILCENTFLTQNIIVCENEIETRKFYFQCDRIIRGYKDISDINYIYKLAELYNLAHIEEKLILIPIQLPNICSTNIKSMLTNDINSVKNFLDPFVYSQVIAKINVK